MTGTDESGSADGLTAQKIQRHSNQFMVDSMRDMRGSGAEVVGDDESDF